MVCIIVAPIYSDLAKISTSLIIYNLSYLKLVLVVSHAHHLHRLSDAIVCARSEDGNSRSSGDFARLGFPFCCPMRPCGEELPPGTGMVCVCQNWIEAASMQSEFLPSTRPYSSKQSRRVDLYIQLVYASFLQPIELPHLCTYFCSASIRTS